MENFAGGLLMTQISEHRLSGADVQKEVEQVKALGVEFKLNTKVDSIEKLAKEYDFVVDCRGRQKPINVPFEYKDVNMKVYQSAEFLRQVNNYYKLHVSKESDVPDFKGKDVVVLGAGNTAMDCCQVAKRLGAEKVTIAFRKQMNDMRAAFSEITGIMKEGIQFQPLSQPVAFENGRVKFEIQEKVGSKYQSAGQFVTLKADVVIVAFGAQAVPVENKPENVYLAGDMNESVSVVEAVNDGKTVASQIYAKATGKEEPKVLPEFMTKVDMVDISTVVNGIKFENPFIISSSPTSLTYEHCRRALLAGWGGVVIKTVCLTKDVHIENALRIFKINQNPGDNTYGNNCMITDHPHEYWALSVKKLKQEFPNKIIIASIMCSDVKEDWEKLAKIMEEAGADAIELNLSCPN